MKRHEQPEISLESIEAGITPLTANQRWFYCGRMRAEQETGWLVSSPGILIADLSFHYGFDGVQVSDGASLTRARLRGSEASLNYESVISYESHMLPKDDSPKTLKRYDKALVPYLREPDLCRHVGRLSILEPGMPIFRPIKSETTFFFDLDMTERGQQVAVSGLNVFLNNRSAMMQGEHAESIELEIERVRDSNRRRDDEAHRALHKWAFGKRG